jgi:hypothetical protein
MFGEIKKFRVTAATNCRALRRCVSVVYSRSRTNEQSFVSVNPVYSVTVDNISMPICDM